MFELDRYYQKKRMEKAFEKIRDVPRFDYDGGPIGLKTACSVDVVFEPRRGPIVERSNEKDRKVIFYEEVRREHNFFPLSW